MKARLIVLTFSLLAVSVAACGGSGAKTRSAASSAVAQTASRDGAATAGAGAAAAPAQNAPPPGSRYKTDYDGDLTDNLTGGYYDEDDRGVRYYGHAADAADRRAIVALLDRYYKAAAAHDGATVCSLVDPLLVEGLGAAGQSGASGSSQTGAGGCAAAMSRTLEHVPGRSSADLAAVRVLGVRVSGDDARALLRLPDSEVRFMPLKREGGAWKVEELFDLTLL